jgi:DNA-binding GntR family transcriptional regulator
MKKALARLERSKSLAERALDMIRNQIIEGRYEFGTALSEITLAEDLGISRTPVREALARLQQEGLVTVRPQRGTFVFNLSPDEFADICDCRTVLESGAFRYAMARAQSTFADALEAICVRMTAARATDDTTAYLRLDSEFHACFFAYCGSPYLAACYRLISGRMAALRYRLGTDPRHMQKSFEEHLEIAAHASRGRLEEALRVLEGHIGRKEGSYWQVATPGSHRASAALADG